MATNLVHYERRTGVARLTLDSPHNRNALSVQLMSELEAGLRAALDDAAVRAILLTHSGRVFCSGADLKQTSASASDLPVATLQEILTTIWGSPKPVVARVAGPARAGGLGLIGAADIAIAAESASFAFSEVRRGLVPAVISRVVLPRMLPRQALELFLTGETFDAHRAVAAGLINHAVADDELDTETNRYLDMLVAGGPNALAGTKALLERPRNEDLRADLDDLFHLSARYFMSDEGREGISAFLEKRETSWVEEAQ